MEKIDLDAIMDATNVTMNGGESINPVTPKTCIRNAMKLAIHQALVLASEKATCFYSSNIEPYVEKQSILDKNIVHTTKNGSKVIWTEVSPILASLMIFSKDHSNTSN